MRSALISLPVALALAVAVACGFDRDSAIASALPAILDGTPPTPIASIWKDVRVFYAARDNAPAWVRAGGAKAKAALAVLHTSTSHGYAAVDYDESNLAADLKALVYAKGDEPNRTEQLAELDARITTALLALGRDVALGRSASVSSDRRWKRRRRPPDFVGSLVAAANGDLKNWLDSIRPPHPEYVALEKTLADLQARRDHGGWPRVPAGPFKPGVSGASVVALKQRLAASGDLNSEDTSPDYDESLEAAVRSFQEHHGLKATGIADGPTVAAMNVPIDVRVRQVEVNLERWRWMPDDFGPRHLLINIPAYTLMVRENGKTVSDIRVVVGKSGHETPIFSADMNQVVFSPYWNVPDSIVEGETAPAAARDPSYLARNDIEILKVSKSGRSPVDPAGIDWDDADALKQLAFRQRPGARNALGHVKFLFPNSFDVYLHDTPADALFARAGRAFSHGCVRVEEPEALAQYVLRDDSEWDQARILTAMNAGVEKFVALKDTLPVHIVYFTVWVDPQGGAYFYPDVYGYDASVR